MSEPVSCAQADVTTWLMSKDAVQTVARKSEKHASLAQQVSDLAYEWAQARAGMLHPSLRSQQEVACKAFIRQVIAGRASTFGFTAFLLWWVLPTLLRLVVTALLEWLLSTPEKMEQWQIYCQNNPRSGSDGSEQLQRPFIRGER